MAKKIAIVGAGISGLGAAWCLHQSGFDVTVYEAHHTTGGHMDSFRKREGENYKRYDLYSGILGQSANVLSLCKLWNIKTIPFTLGFYYDQTDKSWGSYEKSSFYRHYENECLRFTEMMKDIYNNDRALEAGATTIGDFLINHHFSQDFFDHILWPLISYEVVLTRSQLADSSISLFAVVFGMEIFSCFKPIQMLQFPNGKSELTDRLSNEVHDQLRLNTGVKQIIRGESGVRIIDVCGQEEEFDEVILSINFRIIEKIMNDLSTMEKNIFRGIEYSELKTIIHGDASGLPDAFFTEGKPISYVQDSHVTTPVKSGDSLESSHNIFISGSRSNENIPIDKTKIFEIRQALLEHLTPDSLIAKSHIQYIQGYKHTWYCGLSTVPVLAEFCFTSGLVIAERLGASYPFPSDEKAFSNFESMKKLMFSHEQTLYLLESKKPTTH